MSQSDFVSQSDFDRSWPERHHLRRLAAGVGLLAAGLLYWFGARPWHMRWGATDEEVYQPMPGDDLVPFPTMQTTHAITIDAPAADVWPWLVQIGQGKGGFYSYTWLENLVGCHMRNAERIIPEFQHLVVGDQVRLHPQAPPLPVLLVDPGLGIVLGSNTADPGTWAFFLKALSDKRTRLVIRGRSTGRPGLFQWIGAHFVFEPAHFIMERKMLLSIRAIVESSTSLRKDGVSSPES